MNRYTLLFLSIFSFALLSCHKDNKLDATPGIAAEKPYPTTESAGISSHYGTVQYNDSLKRYVINLGNKVFQLSTYSSANCIALPEQDLPVEYKKVGAEVIVTGAIFAKKVIYSASKTIYSFPVTLSKGYDIKPAPDTLNYWDNQYDFIKIKTPQGTIFFSTQMNRMERFGSYTVANIPNNKVYGMGGGIIYQQTESASVTIFDSINRFANNAPDLVKVGLHKYATGVKSPGVSLSWSVANQSYFDAWAGDQTPDCYFKILRSELTSSTAVAKYYRVAAQFRCVLTRTNGSSSYRMLCEGMLVQTIQL